MQCQVVSASYSKHSILFYRMILDEKHLRNHGQIHILTPLKIIHFLLKYYRYSKKVGTSLHKVQKTLYTRMCLFSTVVISENVLRIWTPQYNTFFVQNSHHSHPRVHVVWDEVFHLVLHSSKSDFRKFWRTVVDGNAIIFYSLRFINCSVNLNEDNNRLKYSVIFRKSFPIFP